MLVALYRDHHQLPWWGGRTNPFDVFSPERHRSIPFMGPRIIDEAKNMITGNKTITLEEERYLFSLLLGLHNVNSSDLMAHVSALCDCEMQKKAWWHYPKRVWVQISTLPQEMKDGIPVVYDIVGDLKPEIKNVWGNDNGTHSPYSFFLGEDLKEMAANDSKIWTRFFIEQLDLDEKLRAAKADFRAAKELLTEAKKTVDTYQIFGPNKLNLKLNQRFDVC